MHAVELVDRVPTFRLYHKPDRFVNTELIESAANHSCRVSNGSSWSVNYTVEVQTPLNFVSITVRPVMNEPQTELLHLIFR